MRVYEQHAIKSSPHSILFVSICCILTSLHLDQWQSILSIKSKHCEKQSVSYLSIDGIRLLLSLIPVNTRNGLRDLVLIALLYDSGARVQELIDLTIDRLAFG